MPPRNRLHLSLTFRTLIACAAGLLCGWLISLEGPTGLPYLVFLPVAQRGSDIALAIGRCLAVPLLFASIITGANGLEPMRGVGRLAWKTGAWIAASSALAMLTGLVVGLIFRAAHGGAVFSGDFPTGVRFWVPQWSEMWLALVFIAVGIGVYHNQIEDGRSLVVRFSMAINDTLTLLVHWASRIIPAAVFCMACANATSFFGDGRHVSHRHFSTVLYGLAAAWAIYGLLLLPASLMILARVSPWRYANAVGPAVLAALAGGSPAEVFPLTLDCVRARGGVSNRVSGFALSGCMALLQDGHVVGLALVGALFVPAMTAKACLGIILMTWLFGCGAANFSCVSAPMPIVGFIASLSFYMDSELELFAVMLITWIGNALTVFSQTCAAAVIARSEGEADLLPSRPPLEPFADPLSETPLL